MTLRLNGKTYSIKNVNIKGNIVTITFADGRKLTWDTSKTTDTIEIF